MAIRWLVLGVGAYLLGAMPTGALVARAYGVDLTTQGSRRTGATNALRVLGKRAAVGILVGGLTRVKAYIILREGHEGSEALTEELQNWCKDRLKRYQYPHLVEFVEELPKTVTGKIQRFKLRQPEPEVQMPRQKDELV